MAFTLYKELRYALDGIPDANLTDFPKRFKIVGDADIAAECASGGGIKVTTPDGTTDLPIEVLWSETDLSTGDVEFWVKVDLLTAANVGDVIARLYYAAGETTDEDHAGVWSNGYVLVMHLEEDPSGTAPQMYDSVSESYIGTSGGSMTSGDVVSGQVGNGLEFDGSDDVISVGNPSNLQITGALTVEAWVKGGAQVDRGILTKYDASTNQRGYGLATENVDGTQKVVFYYQRSTAPFNPDDQLISSMNVLNNSWNYLAGTFQPSSASRLYVNGTQDAVDTSSIPSAIANNTANVRIGRINNNNNFLGQIDEVRISSVARSADWIAYAYQDDFANADTFTLGDEEGGSSFADNTRNYLHCILGGVL